MHTAAGETPTWDDKAFRYSCHHGIVSGDTAYVTWRDGGVTLLDVSDRSEPALIAHRNWTPPYGGGTHNALPLPGRGLMVVVDEAVMERQADGVKPIWIFDIRVPANPISIATMPVPEEADYLAKGSRFGPHNVHENRPGTWVSRDRDLRHLQQRRRPHLRHQRPVPAGRDRRLRPGRAGAPDGRPSRRPADLRRR